MKKWNLVTIDDLSEYVTVGYVGSMASEYKEEGVLFLRSQNINPYKLKINPDQVKFISKEFHNKLSKSKLIPGDIAMVRTGYPGTCCVIPESMKELNCSDLVIIRPNNNLADSYFLCYYLNSPLGKGSISGNLVGVAQQHFNVGVAKKIKLNIPDLLTQKKIASILSSYDDLIENNTQRIKLLEEMAEEIYKEWFVRMRFPGYHDTKFFNQEGKEVPHGTVGALPEGWEILRVKDFGKVVTGKTPSKSNDANFSGEIPFIKTPDMQQGMFLIKTEESLSKLGADSQLGQYIPENSISVSCIGTVGKVGITTKLSQTNQQINSLIPKMLETLEYLYFSILSLKPVMECYAATGATMANLSKSKFENLKLVKSKTTLINQFHEVANPLFKEVKILQQKNQFLQETRDLLLPRLISGKLSVEELELNKDVIHA